MVLSPTQTIVDVVNALQNLISHIQWLIGGFFGLYLIYYVFAYFNQRKTVNLLEDIKHELKELNAHLKKK